MKILFKETGETGRSQLESLRNFYRGCLPFLTVFLLFAYSSISKAIDLQTDGHSGWAELPSPDVSDRTPLDGVVNLDTRQWPPKSIEPPSGISNRGEIVVEGSMGKTASKSVTLYYCGESEEQAYQKFGCQEKRKISINQNSGQLLPGYYWVLWGGSMLYPLPVRVMSNPDAKGPWEHYLSSIKIRTLPFEESFGRHDILVYKDLTHPEEKTLLQKFLWATSEPKHFEFCRDRAIEITEAAQRACQAWLGNDFSALDPTWFYVSGAGRFRLAEFEVIKEPEYIYPEWYKLLRDPDDRSAEDFRYLTCYVYYHERCRWPEYDLKTTLDLNWSKRQLLAVAAIEDGDMIGVFPGIYGMDYSVENGLFERVLGFEVK